MGLALDIVFWFFAAICLGTAIVTVILLIARRKEYYIKSATNRDEKNIHRIVQSFLPDGSNNTGQSFVRLIDLGFFATPKTNNHSKVFNDKKHLKNFRKNLTPDKIDALREIGEIYERHSF